ncbi:hypothetical protein GGR50DRAFT_694121 [Xylaria sp. CBS 124048]|nr:hypothetical protein GGR50DRAFT_694121 [Xylaria sp. CBS 124048]
MTYIVSVAYPHDTGFDKEYYLEKHMPLVKSIWAPLGLKKYWVLWYTHPQAPYLVQANLEFPDKETADKAIGSTASAPILDDVQNYSDKPAIFFSGEAIAEVHC